MDSDLARLGQPGNSWSFRGVQHFQPGSAALTMIALWLGERPFTTRYMVTPRAQMSACHEIQGWSGLAGKKGAACYSIATIQAKRSSQAVLSFRLDAHGDSQ